MVSIARWHQEAAPRNGSEARGNVDKFAVRGTETAVRYVRVQELSTAVIWADQMLQVVKSVSVASDAHRHLPSSPSERLAPLGWEGRAWTLVTSRTVIPSVRLPYHSFHVTYMYS